MGSSCEDEEEDGVQLGFGRDGTGDGGGTNHRVIESHFSG